MSYRVNAIEREIARQQMMQQSREIHAAQEAARKKAPGRADIPEGTPPSAAMQMKFAAGFASPEPAPTTAKADPNASKADRFAAGFGGGKGGKEEPTILEKLLAYGERQAAQNTPIPPAEAAPTPVAEASPMERRAATTDASQGQQQATEQLQLPVTSAAIFAELEKQVGTITADPAMPVEIRLRQAFRNLPGEARDAITAQIEEQSFGVPGYLGRYQPDYNSVLIGDALARRLADARRLDPEITAERLLEMMVAAGQG